MEPIVYERPEDVVYDSDQQKETALAIRSVIREALGSVSMGRHAPYKGLHITHRSWPPCMHNETELINCFVVRDDGNAVTVHKGMCKGERMFATMTKIGRDLLTETIVRGSALYYDERGGCP